MPRPWSSRSLIPRRKSAPSRRVAKALPASERGRKQALLERATTLLRDRLQRANDAVPPPVGLSDRRAMAGHRRARSRPARAQAGQGSSTDVFQTGYLGQLARLEPDQVHGAIAEATDSFSNPSYRDAEADRDRFPARDRSSGGGRAGSSICEMVVHDRFHSVHRHTATLPSSRPSRSSPRSSRRRVAGRSWDTRLRLGLRGPRPGRKGQGRCLRGDGSRDPGDRSAAGIGTGTRTGPSGRRRHLDVLGPTPPP